jgi:NAD(P)H-flavin reductase
LKKKDTIDFNGPFGGVQKSILKSSNIKLICTDVGIAPIRQIVHYLLEENTLEKHIELIYGAHNFSELVYHDEWALLSKIHANFSYFPYSTQETNMFCSEGYFTNDSNFITTVPENFHVVVGWERMVNKTKEILKYKGIDKSYIYVQKYT